MKKIFKTFAIMLLLAVGAPVFATPCTIPSDCSGSTPYCDPSTYTCSATPPGSGSGSGAGGSGSGTTGGGGGSGGTLSVSTPLTNPTNLASFDDLVAKVIEAAVQVLSPIVVLAFIYAGFLFVQAQGKPEEIKKAKTTIWYSIVGAFILMGAWGFAQIIKTTVGAIVN